MAELGLGQLPVLSDHLAAQKPTRTAQQQANFLTGLGGILVAPSTREALLAAKCAALEAPKPLATQESGCLNRGDRLFGLPVRKWTAPPTRAPHMPPANNQADSETDFKVILKNAQGKFLAEDDNGFYFTTERRAAKVLNYLADHVAEQLQDLRQTTKIELIPEPVPLEEVYEFCDRCGELFIPTMVLFDGKRFLCRDCAKLTGRPRSV